jgi:hypothetical protein
MSDVTAGLGFDDRDPIAALVSRLDDEGDDEDWGGDDVDDEWDEDEDDDWDEDEDDDWDDDDDDEWDEDEWEEDADDEEEELPPAGLLNAERDDRPPFFAARSPPGGP